MSGMGNEPEPQDDSPTSPPTTNRFSKHVLQAGDLVSSVAVIEEVMSLRLQLIKGEQTEADVEDFASCLPNRRFYDLASAVFPPLRGEQDKKLMENDHAVLSLVDQIVKAAGKYVPHKGGLLAETYEVAIIRTFVSRFVGVVIENFHPHNKEVRLEVAKAFSGLYKLLDWPTWPEFDELAGGDDESDDDKDFGFGQHPKAKKESDMQTTLTGLMNGGNTCYQNIVLQGLSHSNKIMELILAFGDLAMSEDLELKSYQIVIRDTVRDLLQSIALRQNSQSLQHLKELWHGLELAPKGSAESRFKPGYQQDAAEFVTFGLGESLKRFLAPAFGTRTTNEWRCTKCHKPSFSQPLDTPDIITLVPVADEGEKLPDNDRKSLVDVLARKFARINMVEKHCETCNANVPHGELARWNVPEDVDILIAFNIFLRGTANTKKLSTHVVFPEGLFPVRGPDRLYYTKFVGVHLGKRLKSGHYLCYGRSGVEGEEAEGEGVMEVDVASDEESGQKNETGQWTEYEDSQLRRGQRWANVSVSGAKTRVYPAGHVTRQADTHLGRQAIPAVAHAR